MNGADVAVIGGGPAGAVCALLLARGGARVTLLDAVSTRTGAVELISGRGRRIISEAVGEGVFGDAVEIVETISAWNGEAIIGSSALSSPWGAGIAVERASLDRALRDAATAAGARVVEQRVERLDSIGASHIVIAAGRARTRLLPERPRSRQFAICARAAKRGGDAERDPRLYLERVEEGWWYALPDPRGGRFLGFCTAGTPARRPIAELLRTRLRETRLLAAVIGDSDLLGAGGRAAGPYRFDEVEGDRWTAIGDAAFAPDPLSGSGVELAVDGATRVAHGLLRGDSDYTSWLRGIVREHDHLRSAIDGLTDSY